ncbi:MAG TPA: hypothetical protein VF329_02700 [Gammaproteobacteria bacterium]
MAVEPIAFPAEGGTPGGVRPQAIGLPELTVAAFLGRTERGPVDEPVAVESFDEYRRAFGGHTPFSFVSYAVEHFFLNGGERAVVVRLANRATRGVIEIPAEGDVMRLMARRPGSRECLRVSIDYDGVEQDAARFNLVVQRVAKPGSQLVEDQELYPAISIDPDDRRFVVDALQDSELVRVVGPLPRARPSATRAKHPGQPIPYLDMSRPGTDGVELTDYDVIGSNEEGTGLFALDRVERIDLLALPPPPGRDLGNTAFLAAERYCRRRRAMLVWDPPRAWRSTDAAVLGIRAAGLVSHNVLTCFPRLRPRAQFARFPAEIPASGAVAGLLARMDRENGGWPAHGAAQLKSSLTTIVDVGDGQAALLRRFGVNALVRARGGGVMLTGNTCLAPQDAVATLSRRLDTRRATLRVLGALERGTRWVPSALGAPETIVQVEQQAYAFLRKLRERGALAGQRDDQAFFVRASRSRADEASALTLRFGFALCTPGQFQTYEILYRPDGAVTHAVPPLDTEQLAG